MLDAVCMYLLVLNVLLWSFPLGTLAWGVSFGSFRLQTLTRKLSLGTFARSLSTDSEAWGIELLWPPGAAVVFACPLRLR